MRHRPLLTGSSCRLAAAAAAHRRPLTNPPRSCRRLGRFVSNAVALCRPTSTSFLGRPFVPTRAYALDLFPHTPHCELIVHLERQIDDDACTADACTPQL